MSNIEENLEQIKSAVYGREVRQAIHDAIEDCYEDGKAGATDLIARKRITDLETNGATNIALLRETAQRTEGDAALRARIDSLVEEYNIETIEETLWESNTGGSLTGSVLTLKKAVTEFQYIDIYINSAGENQCNTVAAEENKNYTLRCINLSDYTNGTGIPAISAGEFKISFAGNTLNINNHSYVRFSTLSGDPIGGNVNAQYPGTLNGSEGKIVRVVGRKLVVNAEIADARVGADGTTYASLGEAIREQIGSIVSGMNVEVDLAGIMHFTMPEEEEDT